jgi:hypothetical protein
LKEDRKTLNFCLRVKVISSTLSAYQACLPVLAAALETTPEFRGRVLGLHLEGPFLHPGACLDGRQSAAAVAEWALPERACAGGLHLLLALARGHVKLVTVAADAGGDMPAVCAAALSAGVAAVLLGRQCRPTHQQLEAMADAGASGFTDLGAQRRRQMSHQMLGVDCNRPTCSRLVVMNVTTPPPPPSLPTHSPRRAMCTGNGGAEGAVNPLALALGSSAALQWASVVWDGGTHVPLHVANAVSPFGHWPLRRIRDRYYRVDFRGHISSAR